MIKECKKIEFCNAGNIEKIEFRAPMIECAFDYYMVATRSSHDKIAIKCVMSALALEMILKSFNSDVVGNHGQLNETYKFKRYVLPDKANAHDLMILVNALPEYIRDYLFDENDLLVIEENRVTFMVDRYGYEKDAREIYFDDITKLTAKILCKVIYLYRIQGCRDPWVCHWVNIDELFFSDVQKFFM